MLHRFVIMEIRRDPFPYFLYCQDIFLSCTCMKCGLYKPNAINSSTNILNHHKLPNKVVVLQKINRGQMVIPYPVLRHRKEHKKRIISRRKLCSNWRYADLRHIATRHQRYFAGSENSIWSGSLNKKAVKAMFMELSEWLKVIFLAFFCAGKSCKTG